MGCRRKEDRFALPRTFIQLYYQNTRGLRTKLGTFFNNVSTNPANLLAITETGLNDSIHDGELFPRGYSVLRCDRTDGRKQGGALLAAAPSLELQSVAIPGNPNLDAAAFELVCARVLRGKTSVFTCCVLYIPPRSGNDQYMWLFHILEQICLKYSNVLVIGDLNLYSTSTDIQCYYEYFFNLLWFLPVEQYVGCCFN